MAWSRWSGLVSWPLAVVASLTFFVGLGTLVHYADTSRPEASERFSMRWVQVEPQPEVERLTPPPPPPPPPPPEMQMQSPSSAAQSQVNAASPVTSALDASLPAIDAQFDGPAFPSLAGRLNSGPAVETPVYREPPRYPRQALARRLEGWVDLSFQVNAQGQVLPETIEVLAAEPEGVFERSARMAIARWRFAAYETGGQRQLRQRLEFRMESP
ncbi:TonB family protein [Marinospirillum sp. MEB164]|uniref:Protein TonB n=1 Tax=Marinospirillum alkalitolerans TaxID=3123374 RepID=A0ABW8PXD4_9GAMM